MANTTLSSIGGVLQGSDSDEIILGAMGDAACVPGDLVTILATGLVQEVDVGGNTDAFIGILLEDHLTDMDTAIPTTSPCQVVVPRSGHLYGVHVDTDQGVIAGEAYIFHATEDGRLDESQDIEAYHLGRKYRGASGDTFIIVLWA